MKPTYLGLNRANNHWPKDAPTFECHGQRLRGLTPREAERFAANIAGTDRRLWEKHVRTALSVYPTALRADIEARYPTGDR